MRAIFVLLAACGTVAPATAIQSGSSSRVVDTKAQAIAALQTDTPLDYARPFETKPRGRAHTLELFRASCTEGDRYACRIEAQLATDSPERAYRRVAANCRAGDAMSCRALPGSRGAWQFPQDAGAMSRNPECIVGPKPACDLVELRRECGDAFPEACRELSMLDSSSDFRVLTARWQELSVLGCEAGVGEECFVADDVDKTIAPRKMLCDLDLNCAELGMFYQDAGRADLARDTFERACQYGRHPAISCLDLAETYASRKLEEPVVGRGQALLDFACPLLSDSREFVLKYHPVCAQAKAFKQ
jgi:hypothetical protein